MTWQIRYEVFHHAYRADAGAYLKRYRDLLKAIEPTLKPGRIAAPEEIADPIVFLASDGAAFINGATLDVNGGMLIH